MDHVEAAEFYTGLVADLYASLKSNSFPSGRYVDLIETHGHPALELGCGDGDPLLELRERGLDVDGVDSSPDMIARLHERALERGIVVDARVATMEDMRLARKYLTIFLAGPTFNLLPTDEHMVQTLHRIRACLAPDGTAVIPLFVPEPPADDEIGRPRRLATSSGWISVTVLAAERDESARTQRLTLRYERSHGDHRDTLDRAWLLHWIAPRDFSALAADAGLRLVSPLEDVDPDPVDFALRHS